MQGGALKFPANPIKFYFFWPAGHAVIDRIILRLCIAEHTWNYYTMYNAIIWNPK